MRVAVQIEGLPLVALMDGGSTSSLGGQTLFHELQELGIPMQEFTCPILLADHQDREVVAYRAFLEVELGGQMCTTLFTLIPTYVDTPTLLGLDFLERMGVCIDHFAQTWWIHGDLEHHSYRKCDIEVREDSISEVMDSHVKEEKGEGAELPALMVKVGPDLSLRGDEAQNLTEDQMVQVEELLSEFVDIFGEPTGHAKVEAQTIEIEPGARPSMQRP